MRIGEPEQLDLGARTEARRQWRINIANRGGWPEIPRSKLRFEPLGRIVDSRDQAVFKVHRGEVEAAPKTPAVAAYFTSSGGDVVFLERVK